MKVKIMKEEMMKDEKYFDEIVQRLCAIRRSSKNARTRIADVVGTIEDYERSEATQQGMAYMKRLEAEGRLEQAANWLLLEAEGKAMRRELMTLEYVAERLGRLMADGSLNSGLYRYACYQGERPRGESFYAEDVSLPDELKGFKGGSMVLKIADMDRLVDTFCSRNTYYRRTYALLADLDKEVLECVDEGVFPLETMVPYKEEGDALFLFSHFEVDLNEPDERYRTLYVVYEFNGTAS
jgi:hypothetical protein